jgi:hypothetical protein
VWLLPQDSAAEGWWSSSNPPLVKSFLEHFQEITATGHFCFLGIIDARPQILGVGDAGGAQSSSS